MGNYTDYIKSLAAINKSYATADICLKQYLDKNKICYTVETKYHSTFSTNYYCISFCNTAFAVTINEQSPVAFIQGGFGNFEVLGFIDVNTTAFSYRKMGWSKERAIILCNRFNENVSVYGAGLAVADGEHIILHASYLYTDVNSVPLLVMYGIRDVNSLLEIFKGFLVTDN